MTLGRFLAIAPNAPRTLGRSALDVCRRCATQSDLQLVVDSPRLLLAVTPDTEVIRLEGEAGALLGPIFAAGSAMPIRRFDHEMQMEILRSQGLVLIDRCWGNYGAILAGSDERPASILRAPLGALPCLIHQNEEALLVASDLEMLSLGGWKSTGIDWAQMALHLLARDVPRRRTCLLGVSELRGGERLVKEGSRVLVEPLWTPWRAAGAERRITSPQASAAPVREATMRAVQAAISRASHPLLMLSGGLDSSVVAACIARANRSFTCLNLTSDDPSGDERRYARQVASALGTRLIEAVRQAANVDVTRSAAALLPRPSGRSFVQDSDRIASETAKTFGADLLVDGAGGDNVFCSLQSAAPVADALLAGRSPAEVWRTAQDISTLAEASVPNVLWRAFRRAWLRPPRYRWPVDLTFIPPEVVGGAAAAVAHPWLDAPPGAPPGAAAHIALVVAAQGWVEGFDPRAELPAASPLVSQPVVEACLRIPSWLWYRNGRNRAVTRAAFADLLPAQIVNRRSKASPDSFVAELFERNRPTLRALLLDGELAARRLIDASAVERALADPRPAHGHHYRRIMRLADAEAWAAHWR